MADSNLIAAAAPDVDATGRRVGWLSIVAPMERGAAGGRGGAGQYHDGRGVQSYGRR